MSRSPAPRFAVAGRVDTLPAMPPEGSTKTVKSLEEIVDVVGLYPIDAYAFVKQRVEPHGAARPRPRRGRRRAGRRRPAAAAQGSPQAAGQGRRRAAGQPAHLRPRPVPRFAGRGLGPLGPARPHRAGPVERDQHLGFRPASSSPWSSTSTCRRPTRTRWTTFAACTTSARPSRPTTASPPRSTSAAPPPRPSPRRPGRSRRDADDRRRPPRRRQRRPADRCRPAGAAPPAADGPAASPGDPDRCSGSSSPCGVAALLAMYFGEVYPRRHPKAGRPAGQAMSTSTPPFSGSPEGARSGGRSVPLRGDR